MSQHDKFIQEIESYFVSLTEEQFELEKKKFNYEFYNSKMFQGIRVINYAEKYFHNLFPGQQELQIPVPEHSNKIQFY